VNINFNAEFSIAPYIDRGRLLLDCTVNGQDIDDEQGISLVELFDCYMDYFRLPSGEVASYHYKEILEMVGLLRLIAREMEIEVDGLTRGETLDE
jgi:hypothetical protein